MHGPTRHGTTAVGARRPAAVAGGVAGGRNSPSGWPDSASALEARGGGRADWAAGSRTARGRLSCAPVRTVTMPLRRAGVAGVCRDQGSGRIRKAGSRTGVVSGSPAPAGARRISIASLVVGSLCRRRRRLVVDPSYGLPSDRPGVPGVRRGRAFGGPGGGHRPFHAGCPGGSAAGRLLRPLRSFVCCAGRRPAPGSMAGAIVRCRRHPVCIKCFAQAARSPACGHRRNVPGPDEDVDETMEPMSYGRPLEGETRK